MSRDDDYDHAGLRSRRRRAYEEDFEAPSRWRPRRSGAVTTVGVCNIIIGSFTLILGLLSMVGGLALSGFLWHHQQQAGPQGQAANMGGIMVALTLVVTALILLLGAVFIVTGVGVIRRKPWARIVSFVFAGLFTVAGMFILVTIVLLLATPGPAEGWLVGLLLNLLAAGLCVGYAVFVFMALLNLDNAREFE